MSCHPRELKRLRRIPVPESVLEAGRKRLLEFMAETPMVPLGRRPMLLRWRPAAVMLLVAVFVTSGGGIVFAAQRALPGDHLYALKLASEEVQERLAISPAQKFAVQASHAARRLDETEQLMQRNGLAPQERVLRVQSALKAYESHLFAMNVIALTMAVNHPKSEDGRKSIQAAERVLDRHAAMIASATAAQPAMTDAVLDPIDEDIELQTDMMGVMPAASGSDSEEENLQHRHEERTRKIEEHLKSLQLDLGGRSLQPMPKS